MISSVSLQPLLEVQLSVTLALAMIEFILELEWRAATANSSSRGGEEGKYLRATRTVTIGYILDKRAKKERERKRKRKKK